MTLKFYTTEPIEHENPSWKNHHEIPQKYIETILKEKIPNSKLIISDYNKIGEMLNEYAQEADALEISELHRFEEAKKYLSKEHSKKLELIRKDDYDKTRSEMSESIFHRLNLKTEIYEKLSDERMDFKQCLAWWVHEPNGDLQKLENQEYPIDTDVAGIIVPIAHGELHDIPVIIRNIGGNFKSRLEKKLNEKEKWEPKTKVTSEYFFERFGIPIFNSPDFVPGHRHSSTKEVYNDWLIESTLRHDWKEKVKHVEFAYRLWLDRNFKREPILE